MLPLVSVIVPIYNTGEYLKQTIESIINQTYKNLEMVGCKMKLSIYKKKNL